MEFMYCIPDLEVFIDSTIKKCLLEYDLESEDTESVLNDIEKVMVRPVDEVNECDEKSLKDVNHNSQKSRQPFLDTDRIKELSSVLGAVQDLQKLNAIGKTKRSKDDVIASLVKNKNKKLNLPGSVLDLSKVTESAQSEQNSTEEGEGNTRCPSRESKSSTPDISHSPKLPTKLKSRLQQRYFQNSREPSPELMTDMEHHKPRNSISPDSGRVTSTDFDCDHSSSPSPTDQNSRKRLAKAYGDDDEAKRELSPLANGENNVSLGQKRTDLEQPKNKIPRLIDYRYPMSPSSTSSHKPCHQTPKEDDDSLFNLYCLAFRSSLDGSVPIETLNRSMHVPMLLKEQKNTSPAQNKQDQIESRDKHPIATNACSQSSSPMCNPSQSAQNHIAKSQKTNNHNERFQMLKQRLQQRNQSQNQSHRELNSAPQASQHHQELRKQRQGMNGFNDEIVAAQKFLGHASLISTIIAEELMKVEDKIVSTSVSPSDSTKANSSILGVRSRTSPSNLDVHTTDAPTVQNAVPTFTPPSQIPPLIAVTSWHSPPPLIQPPLDTSIYKAVPLRAHQSHLNSSRVCVIPDSSICLQAYPSPPIDQHEYNVPQDLSQKSSRRKVEEDKRQHVFMP